MRHFIEQVKIENYKSIQDIELDLSFYTPLVGYNNAGKSNIMEAIHWLIKPRKLKEEEFNNADVPVEVSAVIKGVNEELLQKLSDNHRTKIEPYINNETIEIRRIGEAGQTVGKMKLDIKDPENGEWRVNPAGINNAIKSIFPDPIHIGAMEDSEEDVSKSKTSTTIGKLLNKIMAPIEEQYGGELKKQLETLNHTIGYDGENRAKELDEFDENVNNKLNEFFPDINIKIDIPTPKLKEVFSNGTIKVFENDLDDPADVGSLGHGAQRSIQMTLIRHLADINQTDDNKVSTTLLFIDEPELYLHPQAAQTLRQALNQLSKQGYQIIFSTHSPFMVTQKDIENTLLVRKNEEKGTFRRKTLKSAIETIAKNHDHQLSLLFALGNSSQILFSERVIIVEGKTERNLLPFLIEEVTGENLGVHKCALVPLDGRDSTKKSIDILEVMDLPCKALVDLDYLKEGIRDGFIEADDKDIEACKNKISELAKQHDMKLTEDGWPKKKESHMTVAQFYNLLAQEKDIEENLRKLRNRLKENNIWLWSKGTIEDHLKIEGKKESIWAKFKNEVEENGLDTQIPDDYDEVKSCLEWLVSV